MRRRRAGACGALLAVILVQATPQHSAAAALPATPIVISGPAPGAPPGVNITSPYAPFIGDGGVVASSVFVNTAPIDQIGMWMGAAAPASALVVPGAQAVGMPAGVTYGSPSPGPHVAGTHAAFRANLQGAGVTSANDAAVYAAHNGNVQLVTRAGDPAPGIAGATMMYPWGFDVNAGGQVAWYSGLEGPGVTAGVNDDAIFLGTPGAAQPVVRGGTLAPGAGGATFRFVGTPSLNDGGKIAHWGRLTGAGVDDETNAEGIWAGTPGSMSMLARAGSPAPGAGAGVSFDSFWDPLISNDDRVFVRANLTGAGVDDSNFDSFWAGPVGGAPTLVARPGQPAPDMPAGFLYYSLIGAKLSGGDKIAFAAQAINAQVDLDDGLWFGDPVNGYDLIAHTADEQFAFTGMWDVNEGGWTVWMQRLADQPAETAAIYARDPFGGRRRVVGPGDQLDVGGGELRTIQQLWFGGNWGPLEGHQQSLSNDGLLAFDVIFTDGSNGVFVTSIVPEPAAGAACGAALLFLGARRHRTRRSTRRTARDDKCGS